MIEGIVRKCHSKNYADGKMKIEIWFRREYEKHFPKRNNYANPVTVIINKDEYNMFFRKTVRNKYLWLSPTVYEKGRRIRLADVMQKYRYKKDNRIFFKRTSNLVYVAIK